jgi:hypothetical protein
MGHIVRLNSSGDLSILPFTRRMPFFSTKGDSFISFDSFGTQRPSLREASSPPIVSTYLDQLQLTSYYIFKCGRTLISLPRLHFIYRRQAYLTAADAFSSLNHDENHSTSDKILPLLLFTCTLLRIASSRPLPQCQKCVVCSLY